MEKNIFKSNDHLNVSFILLKVVIVGETCLAGWQCRNGKEVELERSRRIWRWFGANTLSEIATAGLDVNKSKVGAPVSIVLTEAIEIIDCTPAGVASIEAAKWAA